MGTKNTTNAHHFLKKLNKGELSFGQLIQSLRRCDEISQSELAFQVGVSRARLCDIEKGRKSVTLNLAARLAKVMKYPPTYFISVALRDELKNAGLHYQVDLKAA